MTNLQEKTVLKLKRSLNKTLLLVLLSLSLGLQTGCFRDSNKEEEYQGLKSGDVITEDTPWFDASVYQFNGGYNEFGNVECLEMDFIGCTEKEIVIRCSGNYAVAPSDSEYLIDDIVFLDRETGKETGRTDISSYRTQGLKFNDFGIKDGILVCVVNSIDSKTGEKEERYLLIDGKGNEELKDKSEYFYDENCTAEYYINGYNYSLSYDFDNAFYHVDVKTPEETEHAFVLSCNGTKIYNVRTFLHLDDGKILIPAYTDNGNMYFTYDPETNEVEDKTKAFRWLDDDCSKLESDYSNGNSGYVSDNILYLIDTNDRCFKEIFNGAFCNLMCPELGRTKVIKADDTSVALIDISTSDDSKYLIETINFYSFKKTDTNPNAGKTVIELASDRNSIPDAIAQAVCDYNSNANSDCFIMMTTRYSVEGMSENQEDDMLFMERQADISCQMTTDILNGRGPDMFINHDLITQINNGSCLVDMSDIIGSLPADQYFTNVMEGAAVNGAVYQLPLSFSVIGIQVNSDKKFSQEGVMLNEWSDFVKNYCNGIDPIYLDRLNTFVVLYANMSDRFDSYDLFTADNIDLQILADYCKNMVSPEGTVIEDYYGGTSGDEINAEISVMSGIYDYRYSLSSTGETLFIGLPSTDKRGPSYMLSTTVAISADSKHIDECKDFIKSLFTDTYQEMLAGCGGNVVNKKAFERGCKKYQEYHSENHDNHLQHVIRDVDVENYTRIVDSVSHMFNINSRTLSVVYEEMQPYFLDQKQYDEVILIIADRVRKTTEE